MNSSLVFDKDGNECSVGDVVDEIIDKLSLYGSCGGDGSSVVLRKKNRNVAHDSLVNSVKRGVNPFYVNVRSSARFRRRKRCKYIVPSNVSGKSSVEQKNSLFSCKVCNVLPVMSHGASVLAPGRAITGRKVFAACRGITKAVLLFKLFKAESLPGGSKRVRCYRKRMLKREASVLRSFDHSAASAGLDTLFWGAVASVVRYRDLYKRRLCVIWNDKLNGGEKIPHPLLLLRSLPLFGLVVEVQKLWWRCRDAECGCSPEVVESSMGIVLHESGGFIGVALLGSLESLRIGLENLRKNPEQPISGREEPRSKECGVTHLSSFCSTFPAARVIQVAKVCASGLGPAVPAAVRKPQSGELVVARVAADEVTAPDCPFKELIGRFL
ncbi:hypothetical protein DPX39_050048500 [Trypanosoma brucei equiperdum]|uniref:Uncharacterized protein n=1 Tax=Trypanosoma brucei equiperdum TaxID=630700 RepID=A0A3L6LDX3_9TRYP|nr:hypothetical protein DPX39_050048500 [Trypanosoma brucei equiperdum]